MRNTFPDVIGNIYSDDEAREIEPAPAPKQRVADEDLNKYQAVTLDVIEEAPAPKDPEQEQLDLEELCKREEGLE